MQEANGLRTLLFGDRQKSFNAAWSSQGFPFHETLKYGLVQHEGGPCGVLATVQGFLLAELIHGAKSVDDWSSVGFI